MCNSHFSPSFTKGKIVPEFLQKGQVHSCIFVWANLVLQLSNLGSVMSLTQTSVNSTVNSANWRWKMTQLPSLQRPFPLRKKEIKENERRYNLSAQPSSAHGDGIFDQ